MSFFTVVVTFTGTVLFVLALRPLATVIGLIDVPGGRKNHDVPVPLIGGISMSIGLGFGAAILRQPDFWTPIFLGTYLLVVVGTLDDQFELPPSVRLVAQGCAALSVVWAAGIRVTTPEA